MGDLLALITSTCTSITMVIFQFKARIKLSFLKISSVYLKSKKITEMISFVKNVILLNMFIPNCYWRKFYLLNQEISTNHLRFLLLPRGGEAQILNLHGFLVLFLFVFSNICVSNSYAEKYYKKKKQKGTKNNKCILKYYNQYKKTITARG